MERVFRGSRVPLAALALLVAAGCTRSDDFTLASSKNVQLDLDPAQSHGQHEGSDSRWIILLCPTGLPSMTRAAEAALEKGGGNLILNAELDQETWWYLPLILGRKTYYVKGDIYNVIEPIRYRALTTSTTERTVQTERPADASER